MPRVAANPAVPMQMDVKPKPDWLNKVNRQIYLPLRPILNSIDD